MEIISARKAEMPPSSYPIYLDQNLLKQIENYLPDFALYDAIAIVTDDTVKTLYGDTLLNALKKKKENSFLIAFEAGEASKNIQTKIEIETQLFNYLCGRKTLLLALGGGVVGDLAGFIAATYMRGIDFVQIPTTLLAMVDSSIGGKTGIDTPEGKNLIGAIWQPKAVIADINVLNTLSEEHYINGLIEAIKIFAIYHQDYFTYAYENIDLLLEKNMQGLKKIIKRSIELKSEIVFQDERESGIRALLNYGHTIGHAIESLSNYSVLHGYAVALGIILESKIAVLLNVLSDENYQRIFTLMKQLGIDINLITSYSCEDLIRYTRMDKKSKNAQPHYVLLQEVGQAYVNNKKYTHLIEDKLVEQAYQSVLGEL